MLQKARKLFVQISTKKSIKIHNFQNNKNQRFNNKTELKNLHQQLVVDEEGGLDLDDLVLQVQTVQALFGDVGVFSRDGEVRCEVDLYQLLNRFHLQQIS